MSKHLVLGIVAGVLLVGCGEDEDEALTAEQQLAKACYPICNANNCMACDASGETPVCVSTCGPNLVCEDGQCIASMEQTCEPACGSCQTCDTSGGDPTCVDNCGANMECNNGRCQPPVCDPACAACEFCDIYADGGPTCVDTCGAGTICSMGECQPDPGVGCDPACGPCAVCDTSSGEAVCVELCDVGEYCDAGTCRRDTIHANLPELDTTFAAPQDVTAQCINCHPSAANGLSNSAHWNWRGPTPDMQGYESDDTQGKATVINNFCIATRSNEKRCTVCHAGYGWVDNTYDFNDTSNMDCLVCHASPESGYAKDFQTADGIKAGVDLTVAAKSAGKTTRASCGRCHFGAGGGDNVKKGDIGSELTNPSSAADVHMGRGFTCGDCHYGGNHQFRGQGVHNIVRQGPRPECADCHGDQPHDQNLLDGHTDHLACQTCHVPHFSRQQPTKTYWDWSLAGNKDRNVEQETVGSREVPVYDWKKGEFVWQQNVRPEYAWHDGSVDRMTTNDTFEEAGTTEDPIKLAFPLAGPADGDARIWPFKIMRGKQAADPNRQLVIVPKLFGPGGFWASVPSPFNAAAVEAVWDNALTLGAQAAGQIDAGDSYTTDAWEWLSTEMYMQINHEVAPASEALGCLDCHQDDFEDTFFPWADLGYTCNPATASGCTPRP